MTATPLPRSAATGAQLLLATRQLLFETRPDAAGTAVRLDSRLENDLGLDSLARVELRDRIEQRLHVALPDAILQEATLRAWLATLAAARRGASIGHEDGACVGAASRSEPHAPLAAALDTRFEPAPAETPALLATLADVDTIPGALDWHLRAHPGSPAVRLLHVAPRDEPGPTAPTAPVVDVTYRQLADRAAAVAGGLQAAGVAAGDRVAIMLPTSQDYFVAFLGAMLAGAAVVPIYPPAQPSSLGDHLRRQAGILDNAQARMLITLPSAHLLARLATLAVGSLHAITSVDHLEQAGTEPERPVVSTDATALLQYTSGSTGDPKGVVLAHRHLLASIRAMALAARAGPEDTFVSWLPLYHDMGLIGAWLGSLVVGFRLAIMPPQAFLARAVRWLRAIDLENATISAAPNVGFELCLRVPDAELADLDLSTWRLAFNGAEPVLASTIRRFTDRFSRYGFRPEAMMPVYGLAEAGLGVTFPSPGALPHVDRVERSHFRRTGIARPHAGNAADALEVVSCGRPLPGYEVRVVDLAGFEVADRNEGRVEFTGPSATPGYFRNEDADRRLHHGTWIDTGDLGYLAAGELYLSGRVKDIVIRAGQNLHPEELEQAVGMLSGIRTGCVAVFSSPDPEIGTERLVVMAETRARDPGALTELRRRVVETSVDVLGVPPDVVVLAPPGAVLKTSSGKIRRAASRVRFESGAAERPAPAAWQQLVTLASRGVAPLAWRGARALAGGAHAVALWFLALLIGAPTWLVVQLLPTQRARWALVRAAGGALVQLGGLSITVRGTPPDGRHPAVLVANHASFVDGLALVLASPAPLRIVAGGELASQRVAGPFLRRLGCEFAHQGDPTRAREDVDRLIGALHEGAVLAFFPEGVLSRAPGLRPLRLGAFLAAATADVPVVPVGIAGTRDVVRPGTKFPRAGAVQVTFGVPVVPDGPGWPAALRLRAEARRSLLELSGEPDVGP